MPLNEAVKRAFTARLKEKNLYTDDNLQALMDFRSLTECGGLKSETINGYNNTDTIPKLYAHHDPLYDVNPEDQAAFNRKILNYYDESLLILGTKASETYSRGQDVCKYISAVYQQLDKLKDEVDSAPHQFLHMIAVIHQALPVKINYGQVSKNGHYEPPFHKDIKELIALGYTVKGQPSRALQALGITLMLLGVAAAFSSGFFFGIGALTLPVCIGLFVGGGVSMVAGYGLFSNYGRYGLSKEVMNLAEAVPRPTSMFSQ